MDFAKLKDVSSLSSSALSPYTLVIDDLEAFELMAPSTLDAIKFISITLQLINSPSSPLSNCIRLVSYGRQDSTVASPDLNNSITTVDLSLTEYLRCRATTIAEIHPLATGYSLDVHGLIRITSRYNYSTSNTTDTLQPKPSSTTASANTSQYDRQPTASALNPTRGFLSQRTLIYKALDTGVKCSEVRLNHTKA